MVENDGPQSALGYCFDVLIISPEIAQGRKRLASYVKSHYDVLGKLMGKWPKSLDENQGKQLPTPIVIAKQPKGIVNGTLKSYQLKGLEFLQNMAYSGAGCILGDEMVLADVH